MTTTTQQPEQMATLKCPACRLSLYMPMRTLHQTWTCPNCGKSSPDVRKLPELSFFELELHIM